MIVVYIIAFICAVINFVSNVKEHGVSSTGGRIVAALLFFEIILNSIQQGG